MFDTVAISISFARSLDVDLLVKNGCKPSYSIHTGEVFKLALNGEKGAKEPRLTISKAKENFIIKAEVSIGAWLFGSNLFLPDENDIKDFLCVLPNFVRFKTGFKFNAPVGRMTRLDVTRDFQIGESRVLSIIKELKRLEIPKYNQKPYDTGVCFENRGKEKNKQYLIYSKYHELLSKNADESELELAKGLLRLEVQHKNNRSAGNLAKSLHYPNHDAIYLLTRETSEKVIDGAMKLLHLESLLNAPESKLETLARNFGSSMPLTLAGHLAFKAQFGSNYAELLSINLSEDTIKKYDRQCAKTGTLSLE